MDRSPTEHHINLAFGLNSTPGAYAVLLGAGASTASGMLSAWGIQRDLILKIAAAEKADLPGGDLAPFDWYEQRFGKPAAYDDLLAQIAPTQNERQTLLRGYFEPDESERERGLKQPTAAHRAIARMVASGHIRVIMTLNFDRLMEAALRDLQIEPTVVSSADGLSGMLPLHAQNALVVHLHGDYLAPSSMLNTPEELAAYTPEANRFLDQVLDEYGLIIAGWSANWDPALRAALDRCATRRFHTYWTDLYPLSEPATEVLTQRRATYVHASADDFFGQTADALHAIASTNRHHPAAIAVAVNTAKRELSGERPAISLHDTLRSEASAIAASPVRTDGPWHVADPHPEHERRLALLETECEKLLAVVATAAYWGSPAVDRWWLPDIERLAEPTGRDGLLSLINLTRTPGLMMFYSAGIAAVANERWGLVGHLLAETLTCTNSQGHRTPVAAVLSPDSILGAQQSSARLQQLLQPIFVEHLALGHAAFTDAWERFEYLRLIAQTDHHLTTESGWTGSDVPHIRALGSLDFYQPAPSAWLERALERFGLGSDLDRTIKSGLVGGVRERLVEAKKVYDARFNDWARGTRMRSMIGRGAIALPTSWYPDAIQ
ncbi:SIR2 family protein [Kitasatospora sp. NPDC096128]|uniref:SIR2 family protein n=1 Tax=Kitasatospora sp. NPDC096128 TaxID=3155547 RepID=UPI00331CAE22